VSSGPVEGLSLARARSLCPCRGLLAGLAGLRTVASAGQVRQHFALVDLAEHWCEALGSHLPSSVTHDSYFAVAAAPGHVASAAMVALAY